MMIGQLLHFICRFLLVTGSVYIETVPSGMEILIDGNSYGESPVCVDSLDTGIHRISLIPSPTRLWGIQSLDTLIVIHDQTDSLLLPLPSTIRITSSPHGCLISERNTPIGYTPLIVSRTPDREIVFTAKAPDHIPYSWSWHPLPGGKTHVHVQPIKFIETSSTHSNSRHTNRILYWSAVAVSMAAGSIICASEADRTYNQYGKTANPSEITRLYDRAVLLDRCAGMFWVGFQLTIAGGIAWWLLG